MSEKDQLIENLAARVASLETAVARMDSLEAAIAEMDDDIPDQQNIGVFGDEEDSGDYAFKCTAVPKDGGGYDVHVAAGSAQVLGGEEHLFDDEDVVAQNGDYIYVVYRLWDDLGQAVCAWDGGFQVDSSPPVDEVDTPKSLVFIIAKIGDNYARHVNQYRLGSIQAVALLNAAPEHDDIASVEVP